jgi:UPF0755 protein
MMEQRNIHNNTNIVEDYGQQEEVNWGKLSRTALQGIWSVGRIITIFISSLLIVVAIGVYGYQYITSHFIDPVGSTEAPPQAIIVPKGMTLNKLALLLEDKKLVRSGKVFKYLVDFSGFGAKIKAGYYVLDGSMTMQQILDKLAEGQAPAQITTFTITEGSTIEQVAAQLKKQKIITDTKKFLELCKSGTSFTKYSFVKDAIATKNSSQRYYMLEGYLFPAKYEIYVGTSEEEIINKMLTKTASVLSDTYLARAKQLDMNVDQVMALASMIEKEGKPADFAKISAVFHNRLKTNMYLGSDVTTAYAVHKTGFNLTSTDVKSPSLYNTRNHKGLPLGPIGNPGEQAIKAALYPDEQTMKDGYLYFYLTNPDTGVIEYYKTYKAFQAGIDKYAAIWDAYNKKHSN